MDIKTYEKAIGALDAAIYERAKVLAGLRLVDPAVDWELVLAREIRDLSDAKEILELELEARK